MISSKQYLDNLLGMNEQVNSEPNLFKKMQNFFLDSQPKPNPKELQAEDILDKPIFKIQSQQKKSKSLDSS